MPVIRKLVAVVVADVVGYSRHMERDEAGTHERLRHLRDELIDPKIAEHHGRIVHTAGDGLLLEFPSATSALRCAVEIQREMGVRNLYVAPDDRIEFRIGINLGDIIVEGSDIIGDGVNVAARLETLADPGGICVASAVWEQVHEDLGVEFVDSGEQHVKNISKPIRVFRVALGKGSTAKAKTDTPAPPAPTRETTRPRMVIGAGIGVLLVVLGVGVWQWIERQNPTAPVVASSPPPRSMMVLPFAAPPDDTELQSLADSVTSDITRTLASTLRDALVVAPSVAAVYKGKSFDERQAARDVNVRYLIEGDVRPAGGNVVVTIRLIDAVVAKQLGSERQVIGRARLTPDHEQLVGRLFYAARDMVDNAELRRTSAGGPPSATAQDLVNRAQIVETNQNLASAHEARKLYDEAIRRDSSLAAAWAGRARAEWGEFARDFTADRERLLVEMERDSLRAIALDDHDPMAWHARGLALLAQSRLEAASDAIDRAQALDPTRFFILRGYLDIYSGRASEALKVHETRKLMLDRTDPALLTMICHAHLLLGDYQQAISECERGATGDDTYWVYLNLTAAAAQAGDMERAARARAELMRRAPDLTIARFEAKKFSTNPTWVQQVHTHLIPGLRKAGIPDQ